MAKKWRPWSWWGLSGGAYPTARLSSPPISPSVVFQTSSWEGVLLSSGVTTFRVFFFLSRRSIFFDKNLSGTGRNCGWFPFTKFGSVMRQNVLPRLPWRFSRTATFKSFSVFFYFLLKTPNKNDYQHFNFHLRSCFWFDCSSNSRAGQQIVGYFSVSWNRRYEHFKFWFLIPNF